MAQTPRSAPKARRKRKPLNLTLIKTLIVIVVGSMTALGGAWTGLGAQVVFAPMLSWMLGFGAEKAQATALRYAAFAAAASVFGAYAANQMRAIPATTTLTSEFSASQFWPGGLLSAGLLIFFGATLGAILTVRVAPKPNQITRRRFFQTIGVGVALFVIAEVRLIPTSSGSHYAMWHHLPNVGWLALLALGFLVGGLTQSMGLASGVLMVPALYFIGGYTAGQATALSLFVVTLAALLPAWSYSRRGLVDTTYSTPAAIGGMFGGVLGGLMISHLSDTWVLMLFAVIVMFLSARELARMSLERPPVAEIDTQKNG